MRKVLIFNFLMMSSFANENVDKAEEIAQIVGKNAYEPNYFSMILGLFLVVAMIYVTGFLYQKLTKINMKPKDAHLNKAQIISTTSLGQGRNLHVIKIGQSACLIGSTQNNITYIKDIKLVDVDKKEDSFDVKNS
jgi:flagellar biogenesis protein FliO